MTTVVVRDRNYPSIVLDVIFEDKDLSEATSRESYAKELTQEYDVTLHGIHYEPDRNKMTISVSQH